MVTKDRLKEISEDNCLERARKVKEGIESMLAFEQKDYDNFNKPSEKDEERFNRWKDMTEPIARTISAYQTSLGYLIEYFPELKED